MSNREMITELLERVPDYKIGYVLAYLQGIVADEEADDKFCEDMVRQYEANPDKGQYITVEEAAEQLGVNL